MHFILKIQQKNRRVSIMHPHVRPPACKIHLLGCIPLVPVKQFSVFLHAGNHSIFGIFDMFMSQFCCQFAVAFR